MPASVGDGYSSGVGVSGTGDFEDPLYHPGSGKEEVEEKVVAEDFSVFSPSDQTLALALSNPNNNVVESSESGSLGFISWMRRTLGPLFSDNVASLTTYVTANVASLTTNVTANAASGLNNIAHQYTDNLCQNIDEVGLDHFLGLDTAYLALEEFLARPWVKSELTSMARGENDHINYNDWWHEDGNKFFLSDSSSADATATAGNEEFLQTMSHMKEEFTKRATNKNNFATGIQSTLDYYAIRRCVALPEVAAILRGKDPIDGLRKLNLPDCEHIIAKLEAGESSQKILTEHGPGHLKKIFDIVGKWTVDGRGEQFTNKLLNSRQGRAIIRNMQEQIKELMIRKTPELAGQLFDQVASTLDGTSESADPFVRNIAESIKKQIAENANLQGAVLDNIQPFIKNIIGKALAPGEGSIFGAQLLDELKKSFQKPENQAFLGQAIAAHIPGMADWALKEALDILKSDFSQQETDNSTDHPTNPLVQPILNAFRESFTKHKGSLEKATGEQAGRITSAIIQDSLNYLKKNSKSEEDPQPGFSGEILTQIEAAFCKQEDTLVELAGVIIDNIFHKANSYLARIIRHGDITEGATEQDNSLAARIAKEVYRRFKENVDELMTNGIDMLTEQSSVIVNGASHPNLQNASDKTNRVFQATNNPFIVELLDKLKLSISAVNDLDPKKVLAELKVQRGELEKQIEILPPTYKRVTHRLVKRTMDELSVRKGVEGGKDIDVCDPIPEAWRFAKQVFGVPSTRNLRENSDMVFFDTVEGPTIGKVNLYANKEIIEEAISVGVLTAVMNISQEIREETENSQKFTFGLLTDLTKGVTEHFQRTQRIANYVREPEITDVKNSSNWEIPFGDPNKEGKPDPEAQAWTFKTIDLRGSRKELAQHVMPTVFNIALQGGPEKMPVPPVLQEGLHKLLKDLVLPHLSADAIRESIQPDVLRAGFLHLLECIPLPHEVDQMADDTARGNSGAQSAPPKAMTKEEEDFQLALGEAVLQISSLVFPEIHKLKESIDLIKGHPLVAKDDLTANLLGQKMYPLLDNLMRFYKYENLRSDLKACLEEEHYAALDAVIQYLQANRLNDKLLSKPGKVLEKLKRLPGVNQEALQAVLLDPNFDMITRAIEEKPNSDTFIMYLLNQLDDKVISAKKETPEAHQKRIEREERQLEDRLTKLLVNQSSYLPPLIWQWVSSNLRFGGNNKWADTFATAILWLKITGQNIWKKIQAFWRKVTQHVPGFNEYDQYAAFLDQKDYRKMARNIIADLPKVHHENVLHNCVLMADWRLREMKDAKAAEAAKAAKAVEHNKDTNVQDSGG